MKYVRTEDGIYNTKDIYSPENPKPRLVFIKDIIEQADTIEELIDAILVKGKNEYDKELMVIYQGWLNLKGKEKIEKMKYYINDYLYWQEKGEPTKKELYGIIFVYGKHNEPILKSVAKLNDKGELELL